MPKRFTETEKWKDKWFRSLRPEFKLAWMYLLDNCDQAGVVEVDVELANFQLGVTTDWDEFLDLCGERIARGFNGDKIWICRFIEFQYGSLSEECNAHKPAFLSLKKNRLLEGYLKGTQRVLDKDRDKDRDKDKAKDKDKDKDSSNGTPASGWLIPEGLDTPEVRERLDLFTRMRRKIKKPICDLANTSRVLRRFESPEHLCYALDVCIENEYQGLKPEYKENESKKKQTELFKVELAP